MIVVKKYKASSGVLELEGVQVELTKKERCALKLKQDNEARMIKRLALIEKDAKRDSWLVHKEDLKKERLRVKRKYVCTNRNKRNESWRSIKPSDKENISIGGD